MKLSIALILTIVMSMFDSEPLQSEPHGAPVIPKIQQYVQSLMPELDSIPSERKVVLDEFATWLGKEFANPKGIKLTFVCTHNSRRSHTAQLWALVMAELFHVHGLQAYSGGTQVTKFNERAIKALTEAGFVFQVMEKGGNPLYAILYPSGGPPLYSMSRKYSDFPNPDSDFAAVMVCSEADRECPIVKGATNRFAIPYDDPKEFDGKPEEEEMYRQRCRQIAREMLYVFKKARGI